MTPKINKDGSLRKQYPVKDDLSGMIFGDLLVIKKGVGNTKNRVTHWLCKCGCGLELEVRSSHLKRGQKSCRICYNKDRIVHGLSNSKEYNCWIQMRDRCNNPKNHAYKDYGKRGIKVCKSWNSVGDGFVNFIKDMGLSPTPKHTLDRKNNNEGYCPDNCRWVTQKEQARNKRTNVILEYNGKRMSMIEWSEFLNIKYQTFGKQLRRGLNIEDILNKKIIL
jgi:hypothetical protein